MSKSIDALARGMFVLEEILRNSPVSLAELHRSTEISKATLLRILKTLIEAGWVMRSDEMGGYLFSNSMNNHSRDFNLSVTLRSLAIPVINQLCKESAALVELWAPQTNRMSLIGATQPDNIFLSEHHNNESSLPLLTSTAGLVYLSFSQENERTQLLDGIKTRGGREAMLLKRDPLWLKQTVETIRKQGYAYSKPIISEGCPYRSNLETIAFPISNEEVILSVITLSWQKSSDQLNLDRAIITRAMTAVHEIETALKPSGIQYNNGSQRLSWPACINGAERSYCPEGLNA